MSESHSDAPPPEQPPYLHSAAPSKKFEDALTGLPWQTFEAYNLLVLQATCPECDHEDGINVAVPTVGALPFLATYAGTGPSRAYVECTCSKNHGAPSGEVGCGRWAMITPNLGDLPVLDEPFPTGPATAEPVAEEGNGEKPADKKGAGDGESH
jgi:hypothetical protein